MEEERFLTIDDGEQKILGEMDKTSDPEKLKLLAEGAAVMHNAKSNDIYNEQKLENDRKQRVVNFWLGVGTFIAALFAPSLAQVVKGRYDMEYQDNEIREEKTENYIGRGKTRHRRPR